MLSSWIEAECQNSQSHFCCLQKRCLNRSTSLGDSQTSVRRMLYFTFCKYITVLMSHIFMYCHLEKATRDQQEQLVNKLCLLAGTDFYSYPITKTQKKCVP